MDRLAVVRERLEQADGLSAVLSAAYDAFDDMLSVTEDLQDPAGGAFAAFVMSSASAASGRDAVAAAPSLPTGSAEPWPPAFGHPTEAGPPGPASLPLCDAAADLAGLSQVLAGRLADARALAIDAGDRVACAQASRYAADICSLLAGARDR